MQHDIYRPATLHQITAGIDEHGELRAVSHRLVSPSILQFVFPPAVTPVFDPSCVEGLIETHYGIPNIRVDFKLLHVPVPTSVLGRVLSTNWPRKESTLIIIAARCWPRARVRSPFSILPRKNPTGAIRQSSRSYATQTFPQLLRITSSQIGRLVSAVCES